MYAIFPFEGVSSELFVSLLQYLTCKLNHGARIIEDFGQVKYYNYIY